MKVTCRVCQFLGAVVLLSMIACGGATDHSKRSTGFSLGGEKTGGKADHTRTDCGAPGQLAGELEDNWGEIFAYECVAPAKYPGTVKVFVKPGARSLPWVDLGVRPGPPYTSIWPVAQRASSAPAAAFRPAQTSG